VKDTSDRHVGRIRESLLGMPSSVEDGDRAQGRDALVLDVHRYLVGIARV
jgi:hypothetical protein